MRNGTCPKCGSTSVRAARNGFVTSERPQTLLRPDIGPGFRGMARNQYADVWAYACTRCGALELYVIDPAGIQFIEQQWTEVPSAAGDPGDDLPT